MTLPGFNEGEIEALRGFNAPDIKAKLFLIGSVNRSINDLLDDYLGNEGFCIRHEIKGFPQGRVYEFDAVSEMLKSKTVGEVLDILGDYVDDDRGTSKNREYLLRKLGLWTGEITDWFR